MATQAEICEYLGIKSPTTLKTLINKGVIPAGTPRAGLDYNQCRIAYINYLRNRNKGVVDDAENNEDNNDYQRLLDKERWRKMRRENDIQDGLLVETSVLQETLEDVANKIVPILSTIVVEIKRSWPEMTGDQAAVVESAVNKCLNHISSIEV